MVKIGKYIPLIIVILIGFLFQGAFILIDRTDTPTKAAVEFTQAYYLLDEDTMSARLCRSLSKSNITETYIYKMKQAASERGFALKYVKSRLYKYNIQTIEKGADTAKVRITGKRRSSINPVFEYIAMLFCLVQTYEVDQVIELVKEKDQWKVCGQSFNLT